MQFFDVQMYTIINKNTLDLLILNWKLFNPDILVGKMEAYTNGKIYLKIKVKKRTIL